MLPDSHGPIKLVNARFVDVENGRYFSPQTSLVIQDGRIVHMPGLPGEPDIDGTTPVIDLQDKAVIPGLFNTHCHIQLIPNSEHKGPQIVKNMADCIDRGITNIRDALCTDLEENHALKEKIEHGQIVGPRIHQAVHVGPLGGTYSPQLTIITRFNFSLIGVKLIDYKLKTSGVVAFRPDAGEQEVRDAVDRAVDERGAEAIKFCDQPEHFMTYKPGAKVISFNQLSAAADQAAKRGMPTTMHNVTVNGFRTGVRAGLNSLAHIPIDADLVEQDISQLMSSPTFIEPTATVAYFMTYNIKNSPSNGHPDIQRFNILREHTYRDLIEEVWLPALQQPAIQMDTSLQKGQVKVFGILDITEPFRYYSRVIPAGDNNLRLLVEKGAISRLGCGNDAGPTSVSPASVHHELTTIDFMLNKDGRSIFTSADMLRTATINSARSMGLDRQYGSLAPGKVADLVLLDGDPLSDFSLLGKPVQALFMDGKLVVNRCGLQVRAL